MDVHLSADGVGRRHSRPDTRSNDRRHRRGRRAVGRADSSRGRGARFTRDGRSRFLIAAPDSTSRRSRKCFASSATYRSSSRSRRAAPRPETRRLIEQHGAESRCVVESFDARALDAFRGSAIAIGASTADVKWLLPRVMTRRRVSSLPYAVICVPRWVRGIRVPIASLVRLTQPAGCLVHVWTVNDPAVAQRLWKVGVRGIISDDPGLIRRTRDAAA